MKKMIITGNAGKSPELRYAPSGESFATFSLAVSVGTKDNPRTDWVECSVNGKRAETVMQYVKSGTKLLIEGSPSVSVYMSKDGKPVATLKCSVHNFEFIGGKTEDKEEPAEYSAPAPNAGFNAPAPSLQDDSIPF